MSLYYAPVAKRTRRQRELQWQQLLGKGPNNQSEKGDKETKLSESDLGQEVDEAIKNTTCPSETTTQNESAEPSSPDKLSDKSEAKKSYSGGSKNETEKETKISEIDQGQEVVKNTASETTETPNGPCELTTGKLDEVETLEKSLVDDSKLENNSEDDSDYEDIS